MNRFATTTAVLGLLCSGLAQAYTNPAAQATISAAPSAGQNHSLQVKLDAKGSWSTVPSTTVRMRFAYSHSWKFQPDQNKALWARIYVGEANLHKGGENYYEKSQMFDLNSAQVMAPNGSLNVNLPFSLLVGDGIPGPDVATYCSFEKENRLKQGKTLNHILRYGFNVSLKTPLSLVGFYEMGGGGSRPPSSHQYVVKTDAPVTIQCLGNPAIADQVDPPKGPQGLAAGFQVTEVQLEAQPAKLKGVCPAEITLKATVKGVGGGPIKYWLEEIGGKGAAMQMSSNLPGKVGEPSLRVINQKVVLKPEAGPVQQGIGGFQANTQGQGTLVKRSYRFNVLAPNKQQSSVVNVEVLCTSTLNVDVGGQGNKLQVQPNMPDPHPQPTPGNLRAPQPQPPKPELKLQAPQPQPPKPELQLRAPQPQPEPPRPSLQIKAAEPQPPKPQLQLQAQ
ncbi:hypothetical protein ACOAPY_20350 [Pseudomonas sp. P3C3]